MSVDPRWYFKPVTQLGLLRSLHAYHRRELMIIGLPFTVPLVLAMIGFVAKDGWAEWAPMLWLPGAWVAAWAFYGWWSWPVAVAVFEEGFALHGRRGLTSVRWDEVTEVWMKVVVNQYGTEVKSRLAVSLGDGRKLTLPNVGTPSELRTAIQHGVSTVLRPRYVQALQGGQRVQFGPLALDGDGIYAAGKSLKWSEVEAVRVHDGQISVKKAGGWFSWSKVQVSDVPNFSVFWDLVKHFGRAG